MSSGAVSLISPSQIEPNPENPRLIFREDELLSLEKSIKKQGILVPLTVYAEDSKTFVLLDGERRWRCAKKLNLRKVPAIVQPKPDPLQNIMMMFAIHKARSDWDPLPTAFKLEVLEKQLTPEGGPAPTESALAAAASLTRGEVRRYKRILELPDHYKNRLMEELERPREEQVLTVDHVLESVRGASALYNRSIINAEERDALAEKIVTNFSNKIETKTVAPRLLAKLARSVEREEVSVRDARNSALRLINGDILIEEAFESVGEEADAARNIINLVNRLSSNIEEFSRRKYSLSSESRSYLLMLRKKISALLNA